MIKKFTSSVLFCLCGLTFASGSISTINVINLPIQFRLNYDPVAMPSPEETMGLVGVNFLPEWYSHLYAGISGYGAIKGSNGGLFTLGVTADYQLPLWKGLSFDVNGFVGGGGGKSTYAGDGLMLRGAVGFLYQWQTIGLGIHYSNVQFPSGEIRSNQIGVDLTLPTYLLFTSPSYMGQSIIGNQFGTSADYMALSFPFYFQRPGTKNTDGNVQDGVIKLIGIQVGHYFTKNSYLAISAHGAYAGIPNGYMDVLGGLGYRLWLMNKLALTGQMNLGAGGGAKVSTGGGFLVQPEAGILWNLLPNWNIWLTGGYLDAPDGSLRAPTFSANLAYNFDLASAPNDALSSGPYQVTIWRYHVGNETYFHPQRTEQGVNSNINLVSASFDWLLDPYWFFSGEADSAYSGENAGGLALGLFGIGLQTSGWNERWQIYGQALVGASGGGGLSVNDGEVVQPRVGINFYLTPYIGLNANVGQIIAINGGDLNSTTLSVNLILRAGELLQ